MDIMKEPIIFEGEYIDDDGKKVFVSVMISDPPCPVTLDGGPYNTGILAGICLPKENIEPSDKAGVYPSKPTKEKN